MSVSDPLIKELKGYVRKFIEKGSEITDSSEDLAPFCICLEKCFQKGINTAINPIGIPIYPESWVWMQEIAKVNTKSLYSYTTIVEDVQKNRKVEEATGKFRLLIRSCLNRKCLDAPISYMIRESKLSSYYYKIYSIIGDEILGEIFYSVLLQISNIKFRLNLRNASFLDDTWEMPEAIIAEFVPCRSLGISVSFVGGKTLIIKIERNSVAAEDERIEIGDVLDEINGQVISANTRGNLRKVMSKSVYLPLTVHIVKHKSTSSGLFYPPIAKIIRCSGLEDVKAILEESAESSKLNKSDKNVTNREERNKLFKAGCQIEYCGSIKIEKSAGDVRQIEPAIKKLMESDCVKHVPVRFECLDLSVNIICCSDNQVILKFSYMEISSCGRSENLANYFAFISGDTKCNSARKFEAHIFFHQNSDHILTILQSLGQGFYRTHFAV